MEGDIRLRVLYAEQLLQTRRKLHLLANDRSGKYSKVAEAVQDERLVHAFGNIVVPYIRYGVVRDFERLSKSNALFEKSATQIPKLYEILPVPGVQPTYKSLNSIRADDIKLKQEAYSLYFALYIENEAVEQIQRNPPTTVSGVEAFYMRYPLLRHALKTLTSNYYENIKLACDHICDNWNDIEKAFFLPRKITKLARIQTTGNDFHKGGKQVIILHFALDDGTSGRVVYKPSSVEIDCRIIGNTKIVNSVAPEGYRQTTSLTELINHHLAKRREGDQSTKLDYAPRSLPTYTILPYNRKSVPGNQASVPDAYGYIEFLAHEPIPKPEIADTNEANIPAMVGAFVSSLSEAEALHSDWIVDNSADEQVFYHAFGGIAAMALAASLSDLHHQNVIVHKRLPHLIDLEDALKRPMTSVKQTGIHSALDQFCDWDFTQFPPVNQGRSDLTYDSVARKDFFPSTCVLYRWRGSRNPGTLVGVTQGANNKALVRGFIETIETLATDPCNSEIKAWVKSLGETIARFVTRPTKDYAAVGRTLYRFCVEMRPPSRPGDYDTCAPPNRDRFFPPQVNGTREAWKNKHGSNQNYSWDSLPFFTCEHPNHAWRDYLSCDVPSFYHRLGDLDLLNTKGDIVDVANSKAWQDQNIHPANGLSQVPPPRGPHYFPDSATNIICAQIDGLKQEFINSRRERAFLKTALEGIQNDFPVEDLVEKLAWGRFLAG